MCSDDCEGNPTYASDGDCDDGGSGAEYTGCTFGTDCTDCGARSVNDGIGTSRVVDAKPKGRALQAGGCGSLVQSGGAYQDAKTTFTATFSLQDGT